MDRKVLARRVKEIAYLSGEFRLRSGKTSTFYLDKYRFESDPTLLRSIALEMVALLPETFDKLAGLELGGIPLCTALSLETGKGCLYVRKVAKDYGTENIVEGGLVHGEEVVVIEDVITTAGQVVSSVSEMRNLDLEVKKVVCVIDREQGGREKLSTIGCSLSSVFTLSELEQLTQNYT